jgi:hypothetical protein
MLKLCVAEKGANMFRTKILNGQLERSLAVLATTCGNQTFHNLRHIHPCAAWVWGAWLGVKARNVASIRKLAR